ncbi:hypothetical protein KJK34_15000, partial [Flavobacterium sp. D11R37]|nr:hypothetical protein [Flavobacterium coralii]
GNYYTATGGQGDMLAAGDVITATQTLYVYAVSDTNPDCTAENSFVVTINNTPVLDVPADVASCDSYVLPALATGNYYTGPGATGTMLNADDVITTSQTIYVYASTGTTPDCSAEGSFVVTITDSPVAQVMADVTACDSYTLPALNAGNAYYTGTGGTGDMLAAGEAITATQTIYIFAETGTTPNCTDESSFVVTINPTPQFSLGGPYSACLAETVSISVTGANFNTANATYVWTYEGTTLADNDASITPANGAFGTYEVTVTVNGCT